jgi:alanine-glyoxylate transaminase/serine-glyoxylate transaminase/serine-pyruvate transaminase
MYKCLEALPGVGFLSVSPQAWELVDSHSGVGTGWYLNLRTWRKYVQEWGDWHPSPVTLPVNIILPLKASMEKILAGGLENHFEKYRRASQVVRSGLTDLGFEMLVPETYAAPIVTGVKGRAEFSVSEMMRWLVDEREIAVGGGLGPLAGKIFRVGHLGKAAEQDYLDDFLSAVEAFLQTKKLV